MDITSIIDSLNQAQREAVTAPTHANLILAGAGSGKTRVLVHRIAWLMQAEGASAYEILAVTFTNKAAMEMRGRIEALLDIPAKSLWIGTFHGITHRLLRRHAEEAKLPATFQILDSEDQFRMVKRLMRDLKLDEKKWPPRQVQWSINAQKDEGIRSRDIPASDDPFQQVMTQVYTAYEQTCQRSGVVDFAELLLRAFELLRDNDDLRTHYQRRFRYVLVDEFQDTNSIQYEWLRLLTWQRDNLFVVGDDDQAIYGWRGAKIENIQRYQADFPEHRVVRLEQNYRSSGHILGAANQLILRNSGRMGKTLWTDSGDGDPIKVFAAFNDQEEAHFVVDRIQQACDEGHQLSNVAILYRSNAQSRQFEERLMIKGIAYRVYGGQRFFDRAEVKHGLAYLRLMANRDDDPSFERVVNMPVRGIGPRTLDSVRDTARNHSISLWQAGQRLCDQKSLPARASNALKLFLQLIDRLSAESRGLELYEQVKQGVEGSGLIGHYQQQKDEKDQDRLENLKELVNAARQFDNTFNDDTELEELDLFLAQASLESGDTQAAAYEDCVQLMTLHSSKGLEFERVFLVGLEEGLFPSQQSLLDPAKLEEERRLCYVGMTRAMRWLTITYAESRRLYGRETYPTVSRFVRELPAERLQEIRMKAHVSRPVSVTQVASTGSKRGYRAGQRVNHAKFGQGMVLQMEGEGNNLRVQIQFSEAGVKWLMAVYADLQILG